MIRKKYRAIGNSCGMSKHRASGKTPKNRRAIRQLGYELNRKEPPSKPKGDMKDPKEFFK
jgi:hypothetical protein